MRITKELLDNQVGILNRYTKRTAGEKYYVGYENGCANLFLEVEGGGRQTISYGNTKSELSRQMSVVIGILSIEENRKH